MNSITASHIKSGHIKEKSLNGYLNWEGCRPGGLLLMANMFSACSGLLNAWQTKRKEQTSIAVEAFPSWLGIKINKINRYWHEVKKGKTVVCTLIMGIWIALKMSNSNSIHF